MTFYKAIIIKKEKESDDCTSIYLKCDNNSFELYPGQFCYLQFKSDFKLMRPYSIVSNYATYLDKSIIQFTIKQVSNGLVSNYIKDTAKIGDVIEMSIPKGNLSIKDKKISSILFIAGGSGITMIKTFIDYCMINNKDIFLLYGVKFSHQIIFEQYFESINNPHFKYKIFVSDEKESKYQTGFITKDILDGIFKEAYYDSTFIVGPEAMISKMEQNLKDIKYVGNIYIE